MGSKRLKSKITAHENCILIDELLSTGIGLKNSDTVIRYIGIEQMEDGW